MWIRSNRSFIIATWISKNANSSISPKKNLSCRRLPHESARMVGNGRRVHLARMVRMVHLAKLAWRWACASSRNTMIVVSIVGCGSTAIAIAGGVYAEQWRWRDPNYITICEDQSKSSFSVRVNAITGLHHNRCTRIHGASNAPDGWIRR